MSHPWRKLSIASHMTTCLLHLPSSSKKPIWKCRNIRPIACPEPIPVAASHTRPHSAVVEILCDPVLIDSRVMADSISVVPLRPQVSPRRMNTGDGMPVNPDGPNGGIQCHTGQCREARASSRVSPSPTHDVEGPEAPLSSAGADCHSGMAQISPVVSCCLMGSVGYP